MSEFAITLKVLRKDRCLTQQQLASDLGLSASLLCMFEKGYREPEADVLISIANYFGVDREYLHGGKEIPAIAPEGDGHNDMYVPTMTLNELTALFRSVGISTSEVKLGDGIEQGVYPFGICIKSKKGIRNFEIYKTQVIDYLRARSS